MWQKNSRRLQVFHSLLVTSRWVCNSRVNVQMTQVVRWNARWGSPEVVQKSGFKMSWKRLMDSSIHVLLFASIWSFLSPESVFGTNIPTGLFVLFDCVDVGLLTQRLKVSGLQSLSRWKFASGICLKSQHCFVLSSV